MIGVDPDSKGLADARRLGVESSHEGVDWLLAHEELPQLVFEATSAYIHRANAPRYLAAGIRAIDLTPAAIGPFVVPPVNLVEHINETNVNMVTCGGQATIPMVHAVSAGSSEVDYAEIVATVSSVSAGPGTRQNIDEFTRTTSRGVEVLGGAARGKAIIILNPADPPVMIRDTIFCSLPAGTDHDKVDGSIRQMVESVSYLCAGLPVAQPTRSSTMFPTARAAATGRVADLHRGGGRRRLPAAVRRKPRHHDRGRGQGRRRDRPSSRGGGMTCLTPTTSTSASPTPRCGTARTPSVTSSPRTT